MDFEEWFPREYQEPPEWLLTAEAYFYRFMQILIAAALLLEAEKGAVKEGISFVRLKKPVCFLDHKDKSVTYVIGLSVLNADSINDILYNLVKMFSNDAFKEKLNAIKTEKEMYELIRDKI